MTGQQLEVDMRVLSSNKGSFNRQPEIGSRLRHISGAERGHRDRGWMRDSPAWRKHILLDID